jgi:hypothetical protein
MPDLKQVIPELGLWTTNVEAWIGAVGRFDHAIGYGHLFWPDFKIYQDCILFADTSSESFDHWMQHTNGDRAAVERVLNHRHVLDLFGSSEFKATRNIVLYLGKLLRDMWSCKLARDFPDRTIIVNFDEEYCEDLVDYQITFFHGR